MSVLEGIGVALTGLAVAVVICVVIACGRALVDARFDDRVHGALMGEMGRRGYPERLRLSDAQDVALRRLLPEQWRDSSDDQWLQATQAVLLSLDDHGRHLQALLADKRCEEVVDRMLERVRERGIDALLRSWRWEVRLCLARLWSSSLRSTLPHVVRHYIRQGTTAAGRAAFVLGLVGMLSWVAVPGHREGWSEYLGTWAALSVVVGFLWPAVRWVHQLFALAPAPAADAIPRWKIVLTALLAGGFLVVIWTGNAQEVNWAADGLASRVGQLLADAGWDATAVVVALFAGWLAVMAGVGMWRVAASGISWVARVVRAGIAALVALLAVAAVAPGWLASESTETIGQVVRYAMLLWLLVLLAAVILDLRRMRAECRAAGQPLPTVRRPTVWLIVLAGSCTFASLIEDYVQVSAVRATAASIASVALVVCLLASVISAIGLVGSVGLWWRRTKRAYEEACRMDGASSCSEAASAIPDCDLHPVAEREAQDVDRVVAPLRAAIGKDGHPWVRR